MKKKVVATILIYATIVILMVSGYFCTTETFTVASIITLIASCILMTAICGSFLYHFSGIADFQKGCDNGYTLGYNQGFSAGLESACETKYDTGYNAGYSEGYEKGASSGYNEGFHAGSNATLETLRSKISSQK